MSGPLRPLIVCLLALATLARAGTETPATTLRQATLAAPRRVDQIQVQVGHATLAFSGHCADLVAEGRTVGWMLEGKGSLLLRTNLVPEFPVVTHNLEQFASLAPERTDRELRVPVSFSRARIYWAGLPAPAWSGTTGGDLAPALKAHRDRFEKVNGHDIARLAALQAANAPNRPAVVAELEGDGKLWVYTLDGVERMDECLECAEFAPSSDPTVAGHAWLRRISRQPVGWDFYRGAPLPPFQITRLDVDLRSADNRNASFVVEEDVTSRSESLRCLRFELLQSIATEKERRHLEMTKVLDGQGQPLPFEHTHGALLVWLPKPLAAESTATLRFEYEGDILVRPNNDSYWQLSVKGDWYPASWHLAGENYRFHGTVRTKGDWIAFLPGETVRRTKDGEWNLLESRSQRPICFATVLGGRYYMDEEERDGVTLRIATYAFKPGVGSKVIREQAFNILKYYNALLGPYPFKEFQIIQKNSWGYGQAPPTMMYITNEAFNQQMGWATVFREGLRKRFAHEIAHQYWGTVVKMPSPEDQWVTEAFADYCAALYERAFKGDGLFERSVNTWKAEAEEAKRFGPIPLANDLYFKDGYKEQEVRRGLLYNKGPWLLYTLHEELGEKTFALYLKAIQSNFAWKHLSTFRLGDILNYITKRNHRPFLERYFWGLDLPVPPTKS